jgi:hypothetical protein
MFSQYIRTYEQGQSDVAKLKNVYLSKIRKADEAEDEYVVTVYECIQLT